MSEPTGLVQILQSDLDNFATTVNTAVGVLTTYIAQLKQTAQPLPAADEANLQAAIASLEALEPPAPPAPTP